MLSIFSTRGRLNRKGFFLSFLALTLFWLAVSYLLMQLFPPAKGESFYLTRLVADFLALLSFTPIMLKRLHDISLPGYVLVLFWLAVPLSIRNIVYFNEYLKIEVSAFSWLSTLLTLAAILLTVILFTYKSYSKDNKWGEVC